MEENQSVDTFLEGIAQDDAAQAPELSELLPRHFHSSISSNISLEDAIAETDQPNGSKSEPGWIKKRVETAVEKRLAEVESRIRGEYETQMAPMRAAMIEREADQLIEEGEFKSRERAIEYLQLKKGAPVSAQPRDESGRFAAKQGDGVEARAQMLYAQAETLMASTGVDVMSMYNSDPEVKRKVATGEWSFLDVYKSLPEAGRRIPSPTRSANNGSLSDVNILKMSKAQHDKLNDTLAGGGVINFK